jgi:hypothetical protein
LLQCEDESDDYGIEYQQYSAVNNLLCLVTHLLRISEETRYSESIRSGCNCQIIGKLKSRADKTQINPDYGGDRPAETPGYQRTGCRSAHNADSRRCGHICTHEQARQKQQPEQFVPVPGADIGTDK